jgi:toxin ParE1/3/4
MSRYTLAPLARDDLDRIWEHIDRHSREAADRQIDALRDKFLFLAGQPLLGQRCDHLRPELRVFAAGNYAIFYYPRPHGIEVVAVIHGAQDIDAIFQSGQR